MIPRKWPRPAVVRDEHLEFLDKIGSGGVGMKLAAPALAKKFGISKEDAREILSYWLDNRDSKDNP